MKLSQLKENPVLLLMLGATIVAATRYVTVFAFTEQYRIPGEWWQVVNALSGLGMAVLEGFAVFYCWNAWSRATPGRERNVLLALIVAMFTTLTGAVMPAMTATTLGATLPEVMPGAWLWLWSGCVTVSPFLVMAASGLADKLRNGSRRAQGEAKPAQQALQVVAQPERAALTLREAIQANPQGSLTEWAQAVGVSRQAVAQKVKRLETAGKLRRNGHIVFIDPDQDQA
jgi:hypothetical protein